MSDFLASSNQDSQSSTSSYRPVEGESESSTDEGEVALSSSDEGSTTGDGEGEEGSTIVDEEEDSSSGGDERSITIRGDEHNLDRGDERSLAWIIDEDRVRGTEDYHTMQPTQSCTGCRAGKQVPHLAANPETDTRNDEVDTDMEDSGNIKIPAYEARGTDDNHSMERAQSSTDHHNGKHIVEVLSDSEIDVEGVRGTDMEDSEDTEFPVEFVFDDSVCTGCARLYFLYP